MTKPNIPTTGCEMLETIVKNLEWLGHDAFCLPVVGKILYFDPYRLAGRLKQADIIFVSHSHSDHCSPQDVEKITGPNTVLVTEPSSASRLTTGFAQTIVMRPGETIDLDGIRVEAVPAYNIDKKFHPKANNWLGFVVTIKGVRIYHAGDTDFIPEMKEIRADIALLPVSGTYTMTALEAAQAAIEIKPAVAIPMHVGRHVGALADAARFESALVGKIRVEMLAMVNP